MQTIQQCAAAVAADVVPNQKGVLNDLRLHTTEKTVSLQSNRGGCPMSFEQRTIPICMSPSA